MNAVFDKTTRFLVVDDIESMRKLISKNLQAMGYTRVVHAANGREALRALEQDAAIGVVLTDWNMPVMSGLELLRAIRGSEKLKQLPVLMVTAEIARNQVEEAIQAGVTDFLIKPFNAGSLQNKLDRILSRRKQGKITGPATGAQVSGASPATPRVLGDAPEARRSDEPPALLITEDLQARMTKQASILVVDDIADNIDVLVGVLQDEYKVRAATSGQAALKILGDRSELPDLILLDIMMPEMDGFEVCRRLKSNPATAGIPVIFLTATDDVQNVVQGFALGAVDYITKPANPTVLKVRVVNHLTRSKAFSELQKKHQLMAENVRLREDVERITAHDLKNPIGGIINFTEMLLSDGMMTNDQKEILETIDESAHTLLNLVNLSLDLFKIEQGTYALQRSRVDLAQVMSRLLKERGPEIDAKKIKLIRTLEGRSLLEDELPEFHAQGDELLCYSMLGNLVRNAVEASHDDAALTIGYAKTGNGCGAITITNAGVVPADIRASFFEKYATSGKKGGTGLGTYSAKLLAEVQGGSIAMQTSDETRATTITVTLPLDG